MDKWLESIGTRAPPESLQRDVVMLLKQNKKLEKYISGIDSCNLTVMHIALLAYLANDGVVIMTSADNSETEAIHLENSIAEDELEICFKQCQTNLTEELAQFENELKLLTVDDSGD